MSASYRSAMNYTIKGDVVFANRTEALNAGLPNGQVTADIKLPATATLVQAELGCNGGIAFDVAAVCSGFLYALATADSLMRTGMAKCALVIGAETLSRITVDPAGTDARSRFADARMRSCSLLASPQ